VLAYVYQLASWRQVGGGYPVPPRDLAVPDELCRAGGCLMAAGNGAIPMQGFLSRLNATQLAAPILILMILAMMVLPLPPFMLDVLLHLQYRHLDLVCWLRSTFQKPLISRCSRRFAGHHPVAFVAQRGLDPDCDA
jgi:hypothetical protein